MAKKNPKGKDKRRRVKKEEQFPWNGAYEILAITLYYQGWGYETINRAMGVRTQRELGHYCSIEGKAVETRVRKLIIHYKSPGKEVYQYPMFDRMPHRIAVGNSHEARKRWKETIDSLKKHNIDSDYAARVLGGTKEEWEELLHPNKQDIFGATDEDNKK